MEPIVSRTYCTRFILQHIRHFAAKPKIVLDDKTSILLSNNEIKYRQHLGIIKPRTPTFPDWALKEIKDILIEKQIALKSITESTLKLNYYLHSRHLPLENHQLTTKLQKVEKRLNDIQAKKNGERIAIEDIDFQKDRKARNILKQNIYNWQPINFDKSTCLTYLVARSVPNYAVLHKILNEIKERDKDFKPETMFDFGSGIGTVMWVTSEMWSSSMKEYFCVEISEAMIKLSERLAKAAKPEIKEIFYRQYFPASMNPTYDIVISAYSLFEMPSQESRLGTILKLWKKTGKYLIIVEKGTNAGFKLVNEARDFILKYANSRPKYEREPAHVFSPCPHDLKCPRFATDDTPCNFVVFYEPLKFQKNKEHIPEPYSYVVLKKGKRPEDDEQWPRIVRTTLQRHKHYICRMCVANGELKEEIFTKYKHGKYMYNCAKSSVWGDRLPFRYEQEQENLKEDNIDDEKSNT